jgi:hypothetical protein
VASSACTKASSSDIIDIIPDTLTGTNVVDAPKNGGLFKKKTLRVFSAELSYHVISIPLFMEYHYHGLNMILHRHTYIIYIYPKNIFLTVSELCYLDKRY